VFGHRAEDLEGRVFVSYHTLAKVMFGGGIVFDLQGKINLRSLFVNPRDLCDGKMSNTFLFLCEIEIRTQNKYPFAFPGLKSMFQQLAGERRFLFGEPWLWPRVA
jgi:hypothetical protein